MKPDPRLPSAAEGHNPNFNSVPAPPSWKSERIGFDNEGAEWFRFRVWAWVHSFDDTLRAGCLDFHFTLGSAEPSNRSKFLYLNTREGGVTCRYHRLPPGYFRQFHLMKQDSDNLPGSWEKIQKAHHEKRQVTIEGYIYNPTEPEDPGNPDAVAALERGRFVGFDAQNTCPIVKISKIELHSQHGAWENPFKGLLAFALGNSPI